LILGIFSANAQNYKSYFGEEYTKWSVYYQECEYSYSQIFLSPHDRIEEINGITYFCLFDMYHDTSSTSVPVTENPVAYMRENSTTGQLFFRYKSGDTGEFSEIVVSDMSLDVGDSIQIFDYELKWQNLIISEENIAYAIVDSIYYLNDLKHIRTSARFYHEWVSKYDHLTFIETMGSNISPMLDLPEFNVSCFRGIPISLCYETEKELIHYYPDVYQSNCLIIYTGIEDLENKPMVNETIQGGLLCLSFGQSFNGQINLFNYSGKMLYKTNISNKTSFEIDISKFSKGIYVLHIRSANNEIINRKIINF
jgi:hypothetical protein